MVSTAAIELQFVREANGFTRLEARQQLEAPLERVFPFFADASNLGRITPPWVRFELLTEVPIEMRVGTTLDYRIRIRGVPLRWRSLITAWEPPHRFVDEQTRGPYRDWIHEHRFESDGNRTVAFDTVRYRVPLGRLVEPFLVRPDVRKIFLHRGASIPALVAGEAD